MITICIYTHFGLNIHHTFYIVFSQGSKTLENDFVCAEDNNDSIKTIHTFFVGHRVWSD